jgi:hypothetical protein
VAHEYAHTVITLAAASFLEDNGNGVVLHESKSGRAAGLHLVLGARGRAAVEVKAPRALRYRPTDPSPEEARAIIAAAMKGTGTGSKGQLARALPGLLIVGGFHLTREAIAQLERTAEAYLHDAARAGRHKHLLGIAPLSVSSMVQLTDSLPGSAGKMSGTLLAGLALNPGYTGDVRMSAERSPTLRARYRGTSLE